VDARLDDVGDSQADDDGHGRVEQQEARQAPGHFASQLGRHEDVGHGHENQRRSERAQQLQNHLAGNLEDQGVLAQHEPRHGPDDHGQQDPQVQWNVVPTLKNTLARSRLCRHRFISNHSDVEKGDGKGEPRMKHG